MRSASTGSEHSQEKGQAIHRFFPTWTFPFSPIEISFLFKIRTRDEIRFAFVTLFLSRTPPRVCVIIPLRQKDESRGSGSGKHGDPRQRLYRWRKRFRQIVCITIDLEKESVLRTKRARRCRSVLFHRSL